MPKQMTKYGMHPRKKWYTLVKCTDICECIGQKKYVTGVIQANSTKYRKLSKRQIPNGW